MCNTNSFYFLCPLTSKVMCQKTERNDEENGIWRGRRSLWLVCVVSAALQSVVSTAVQSVSSLSSSMYRLRHRPVCIVSVVQPVSPPLSSLCRLRRPVCVVSTVQSVSPPPSSLCRLHRPVCVVSAVQSVSSLPPSLCRLHRPVCVASVVQSVSSPPPSLCGPSSVRGRSPHIAVIFAVSIRRSALRVAALH